MTIGTQMIICDDQCSAIMEVAERCQFWSKASNFAPSDPFVDYLQNFNCSDPRTYLIKGISTNGMECLPLTNFRKSINIRSIIGLFIMMWNNIN